MSLERSFAFPPSYRLVPAEVLAARREAAAQLARREGLAGLLFTYRTDLYHLTGSLAQGALFLPARASRSSWSAAIRGGARPRAPCRWWRWTACRPWPAS